MTERSNTYVLHSTQVVTSSGVGERWVTVHGDKIGMISDEAPLDNPIISYGDAVIMPGLVDSHVHINEPGRTEWEGFFTATQAALAGGVTAVVDMPLNCMPVTTTLIALHEKRQALGDQLHVDLGYWGGVVPGNSEELTALIEGGVLGAKAFMCHSGIDDFPDSDRETLKRAMLKLKEAGAPLLLHAELESAVEITDHHHDSYQSYLQSRPSSWEINAIALAIELIRETGCPTHIVHLSAADALPMIKAAKAEGLPLTVETCPHYLCLTAEEIANKQTQFKCAPPIRNAANRESLWQGLIDGVIDFIVSDHSPCTPELKKLDTGDFHDAWGGISSLQLGLPNIWTEGQNRGLSLEQLTQWLCTRPALFAGIDDRKGSIKVGLDADFVIWHPQDRFILEPAHLRFKHKLSPYLGRRLSGRVSHTYLRGLLAYAEGDILIAEGQELLFRH